MWQSIVNFYLLSECLHASLPLAGVVFESLFVQVVVENDFVSLLIVQVKDVLDLCLFALDFILKVVLLVIEFVFESQEVLVERDSVSEERFVATSLILLVDFAVLQHLDLSLHGGDLFLQVQDNLLLEVFVGFFLVLEVSSLLHFFSGSLEV